MARISIIGLIFILLFASGHCCAATAEALVDPMRPVRYQNPATTSTVIKKKNQGETHDWQLTAVLLSARRSVAVINGKPLQVGERLDGYKLVQIKSDRVILKNKQKTLVLHRSGTGLKKMSTKRDIGKGSKP